MPLLKHNTIVTEKKVLCKILLTLWTEYCLLAFFPNTANNNDYMNISTCIWRKVFYYTGGKMKQIRLLMAVVCLTHVTCNEPPCYYVCCNASCSVKCRQCYQRLNGVYSVSLYEPYQQYVFFKYYLIFIKSWWLKQQSFSNIIKPYFNLPSTLNWQ